ncbi:MAG: hypothetical protein O2779_04345 [Nanoarchaeota archaeon]|nr:hypothetical protein [Nanoarchaeota archaeon]
MEREDHLVISIKLNKLWVERLIYFAIIIGLIATIFINPMGTKNCVQSSTPVVENAAPVVATLIPVVETPAVVETPVVETPVVETSTKNLTGNITLEIGAIETTPGNNTLKVDSVFITIKNEKELFTPKIRLYWYTPSTDTDAKNRQRTEYVYPSLIPTSLVNAIKLDTELTSHYVIGYDNKDNKLYVIAELLNAADDTLITTVTKSVTV